MFSGYMVVLDHFLRIQGVLDHVLRIQGVLGRVISTLSTMFQSGYRVYLGMFSEYRVQCGTLCT